MDDTKKVDHNLSSDLQRLKNGSIKTFSVSSRRKKKKIKICANHFSLGGVSKKGRAMKTSREE